MKEFFKKSAVIDIIVANLVALVVCLLFRETDTWRVVESCYLVFILSYAKDTWKNILDIKKKTEI